MRSFHAVTARLGKLAAMTLVAAGMASAAQAEIRRPIQVQSVCDRPLRIMISHADGYRNWHPHGWWVFQPKEGPKSLAVEGRVLTQLEDHELYFYAESTDGTFSWEGGTFVNFNGTRYPMRKATTVVERGNLVLILNCNKGTEL